MTNSTKGGNYEFYCPLSLYGLHLRIIMSTLNIPLSVTAVMGNILIIAALRKIPTSSLHPPSKFLFSCLACTDLGVGLITAFIPQLFMVYRTLQALLLPCYLAVHNRGDILRRLISNCDYYKCGQTSRHVIKTSISTSGYVETSAARPSSLLASQLWCSDDNVLRLAPLHNIDQHHTICVSNDLDCVLCDDLSDSPSTSASSARHRLSSRA